MIRAILAVVFATLLSGCCRQEARTVPAYYLNILEGLSLVPSAVTRNQEGRFEKLAVTEQYAIGHFEDLGVRWSLSQANHPYGFWLEITNESRGAIRILWDEANYVDEAGVAHEIFSQPRGPLPDNPTALKPRSPETVTSGAIIRPTIVPIYKQYFVASGCREVIPFSEPLIPSRLDDKSESEARRGVVRVLDEGIPVKLIVPVEASGNRYEYTFEFVLRRR